MLIQNESSVCAVHTNWEPVELIWDIVNASHLRHLLA